MKFGKKVQIYPCSGELYSVRIRVSYNGDRRDLYTGISVKKNQWDDKDKRIKNGVCIGGYNFSALNQRIGEQLSFVDEYFNKGDVLKTTISLKDLKERFNSQFKTTNVKDWSNDFYFVFEKFIKEIASENSWGDDLKNKVSRLKDKLKEFMPKLRFQDLSTGTMNEIKEHLSKTMWNDSLKKHLTYFNQFIMWAKVRKYPINDEYFLFRPKLPQSQKQVRYLTIEELNEIYNFDFSKQQALERVRDMFCFQCYTSLRFSDLKQLTHDNIHQNEKGEYEIDILTEKDNDRVKYRLPRRAVELYLKYKDNLYENNLVFPIIAPQKYNNYLKKIGKEVNLKGEWTDYEYRLNEKITIKIPKTELSSHTARKTFIVNALNEGISSDLISLITSHSDVKSMKPYIKLNTRGTDKVIDAIDNTYYKEFKNH